MKLFNTSKVLSLAMAAMVLFTACSKDGDQGPQGETGTTGPQGPAGPAGESGITDVYYSDWKDVTFQAIDQNGDEQPEAFISLIDVPEITEDIIGGGEIKVYINVGSDTEPEIMALPYLDQIIPTFSLGSINLVAFGNYGTFEEEGQTFNQYRYVIIPGTVKLALENKKIDINNYQQVASALHLQ
ncbi:collagen-like triple helix repeat-containing protein [Flavihumibacter petaseus]|nr:collagen-like protein [Flavihumibacter petaseus]